MYTKEGCFYRSTETVCCSILTIRVRQLERCQIVRLAIVRININTDDLKWYFLATTVNSAVAATAIVITFHSFHIDISVNQMHSIPFHLVPLPSHYGNCEN